jgi:hypothetical protein
MGRGMDLGRTQSIETLVRHHEAVEQRLSSSLRQAELVDSALTGLDHQLDDVDEPGTAEALRASARALLAVAAGQDGYDVMVVPHGGGMGVRVRNTLFGLRADVVPPAASRIPDEPRVEQAAAHVDGVEKPT